jgi:hypothetical protein
MRYKTNFPQIYENFIKYTMKTKIYKYKLKFGYTCTEILGFSWDQQPKLNTISFSDEGSFQ